MVSPVLSFNISLLYHSYFFFYMQNQNHKPVKSIRVCVGHVW
ncbi:hypothetical protein CLOBOL_07257 [Enterocloster bolteae ATCC BAA-613]|uniref:Uncharacterized protein n=1 Tax=Enterocloster bolteae (strain ATCC BAA-613 / DSM 15670 / CCUG 46953 / JCM 12243 / WAL 16351) TaxID=411902 RepID=A8S5M8_ENTBW|nr:hypothetical protein CLOBOL_07257 [Enterocloster bolteae ATCC BAA-613]